MLYLYPDHTGTGRACAVPVSMNRTITGRASAVPVSKDCTCTGRACARRPGLQTNQLRNLKTRNLKKTSWEIDRYKDRQIVRDNIRLH